MIAVALVFALAQEGLPMEDRDIPIEEPADAAMASDAEVAAFHAWAKAAWLGESLEGAGWRHRPVGLPEPRFPDGPREGDACRSEGGSEVLVG